MNNVTRSVACLIVALLFSLAAPLVAASEAGSLDMSYRRVLPLEAGSNFRDGGDYPTADGKRVVRGQLFRSAAMYAIESDADLAYLQQFGFKTVLDLRSLEERQLQPDRWVLADPSINYLAHDYSFMAMMKNFTETRKKMAAASKTVSTKSLMPAMYKGMSASLKPQLKLYFQALLEQQTPIIVHCSAGQDRTGFVSAMMLEALGVERNLILEDYQLSTDFRRPLVEKGDLDYVEAAKTNAFAKAMLSFGAGQKQTRGSPLRTADGQSFLSFAFAAIEAQYGSVDNYLKREIGLSDADFAKLKALYTQ